MPAYSARLSNTRHKTTSPNMTAVAYQPGPPRLANVHTYLAPEVVWANVFIVNQSVRDRG
jgi:hypothetical protein